MSHEHNLVLTTPVNNERVIYEGEGMLIKTNNKGNGIVVNGFNIPFKQISWLASNKKVDIIRSIMAKLISD